MNDLINKNDLYKKCESIHKILVEDKITDKEAFRDLFNAVADAPPETDVKKVVHAEWIDTEMKNVYGGKVMKCSHCGTRLIMSPERYENRFKYERYCSVCGAEIYGESE